MKRTLGTILFLLTAGLVGAQNPSKAIPGAATSIGECGPLGCLEPGGGAVSAPQGGSPVVIRTQGGTTANSGSGAATTAAAAAVTPNPVAPPPPPNDFQQFVSGTLGRDLPVFGSSLFANGGGSFAPSSGVVPPADYVLGTGDQVLIRTWGKIDIDIRTTVDRNGQIFVPRIGTLTVAGLRLDRLTDFIRTAISQQFTGFELSVSLGELRSIQIFVLGSARAPGLYTINSLTTLVNALFSSGGPSANGTMRDIQLKREGKVISHFDVYRLLLSGDKSADMRLLPGDIIFIPPLGPQIAVDGDVAMPAIYEIRPGDTVGSALTDAGGLTPVAETSRAVLEHVIDHSRRSIEELALDAKGLAIPLQTADILRVFPLSPRIVDAVTLRGNVAQPGRYAWRPGMRVSDIIPNREFLLTRAYYNGQNALDRSPGSNPFSASPGTEVPGTASHDTEINWNYAVIERLDPADLTTHLVPFKLGEAVSNPASPENQPLNAGDVIVVYSQRDVTLPLELQAKFVRIDGQVKAPGTYRVRIDETLRELVEQAGGLVSHAYLYAAQLSRESVRAEQAARLKTFVARESQEVLAPSNQRTTLNGGSDLELRRAYIAQISSLQPDGRVVLRIPVNAATTADVPAIQLEDGDHFFVPTLPTTVDVLGAVYNPAALSFTPGARARSYLDQAGGATREADRKREFILRANGSLISRQNVSNFDRIPLSPGDAFVVPSKIRPGFSAYDLLGLSQVVGTAAVSAVAIEAVK